MTKVSSYLAPSAKYVHVKGSLFFYGDQPIIIRDEEVELTNDLKNTMYVYGCTQSSSFAGSKMAQHKEELKSVFKEYDLEFSDGYWTSLRLKKVNQ